MPEKSFFEKNWKGRLIFVFLIADMQIAFACYIQKKHATQRKALQITFIYACKELNCRNSRVALNDLKRAKQESFVVTLQRCFCSFVECLCKTIPHKVIDNAPKAK